MTLPVHNRRKLCQKNVNRFSQFLQRWKGRFSTKSM